MALYNIYRPQNFDEIVGQSYIVKILKNAILQNKTSGAYLFVGPKGTGKTTNARILAKAICCESKESNTYNPCNKCEFCMNITKGNFIDVIEIDAASHRTIEETKSILENIKYHPTQAKKKVYIIDECHMLTKESFNALLKTLEEPPPYLHFILATTDVHKVPITIISRCQRYDFQRISIDDILRKLTYILKQQNIISDENALKIIAKQAQGGLRDAEVLLEQIITSLDKDDILSVDKVLSALNLLPLNIYEDINELIKQGNAQKAIEQIHSIYMNGIDIDSFLNMWITYLRDQMIEIGIKNEPISFYINLIETLLDSKRFYHIESNPIMFLEIAIIKFTKSTQQSTSKTTTPNISKQHIEPSLTEKIGNININEFKQNWIKLINDSSITMPIRNVLKMAVFKELNEKTLVFKISSKAMYDKITDSTVGYQLNNLVKQYMNDTYNIKFIYETNEKIQNEIYKTDAQLSSEYKESKITVNDFAKMVGGEVN